MSPGPSSTPEPGSRSFDYITNTDSISGIAIHPQTGHVWTVGGGGVSEWNPETESATVYTVADGLPSHNVSAVAAAPDGRVWVGTRGSGAAYHAPGAGFSHFPLGGGQWDNDVLSLDLDPDGSLWLGTGAGAVRVSTDGSVERTAVTGMVVATARDGAGNRWFGKYHEGVQRLGPDGTVTSFRAAGTGLTHDLVLDMAADPSGRVWILSGDYFTREEGSVFQPAVDVVDAAGRWAHVDVTGWLEDGGIGDVVFDAAGDAWFASNEGIFAPQADGTWLRETDSPASDLVFDSGGVLWAAAFQGLARRDASGEWRSLVRGALPGSSVQSIDIASDGTAWFGTGGGGLARLDTDGSWRTYTHADGLFGLGANAVAADFSGGVWFASADWIDGEDEGGVHYLAPDGTLAGYGVTDGLASGTVSEIALDEHGGAWFASGTYYYAPGVRRDGGVTYRSPDGAWKQFHQSDGLPAGGDVSALAIADDGTVWAGSSVNAGAEAQSLARLVAGGRWEPVDMPLAPVGDDVYDLAFDSEGSLWVATWGGVFVRSADGAWQTPEDDPALATQVYAIAMDRSGALWFGTSDGVRIRHADGIWESITQADGLGFARVETIAIGPDGRVWLAGREGGATVVTP